MALSPSGIVNFNLSPGQTNDGVALRSLWEEWPWKSIEHVIADKGYDSNPLREVIRSHQATPVIPYRESRWFPGSYDEDLYSTRTTIERFFGRLKENKRIALRADKLDITFSSFMSLAAMKALHLLC